MRSAQRNEAGSGATLSSLKDAKADGPAPPLTLVENRWLADPTEISPSTAIHSNVVGSLENLTAALKSGLLGLIRWDEFTHTEVLEKDCSRTELERAEITRLMVECQKRGFAKMSRQSFEEVVHLVAKDNPFDSAQEWLNSLPSWDGIPRIERFLPDFLGTLDRPYELAVGRYWWTAMAARIQSPGCKADMVPILVGSQGVGKSSVLAAIAPTAEHWGDVCLTERSSDLASKIHGKIVVIWEELRGIRGRVDADEVKAFITRPYVELRRAGSSRMERRLRRFIIAGTSNRRDFLRDCTGHRRELPFDVYAIDLERVRTCREQLWAEARHVVSERQANGQSLVDYEDAERLVVAQHHRYVDQARWVDHEGLLTWLKGGAARFRTDDALRVVGIVSPGRDDRSEMRKSLEQLGLEFRSTYFKGRPNRPKSWQWPAVSSKRGEPWRERTPTFESREYIQGYEKSADFREADGFVLASWGSLNLTQDACTDGGHASNPREGRVEY